MARTAPLDKDRTAPLDKEMAALETRLVRNVYTVATAQIVIIVGLLKLIPQAAPRQGTAA